MFKKENREINDQDRLKITLKWRLIKDRHHQKNSCF